MFYDRKSPQLVDAQRVERKDSIVVAAVCVALVCLFLLAQCVSQ